MKVRSTVVIKIFPCLALCAALLGCGEKYALDSQMEALCKKDGGIKVYETVTIPPDRFDQNGYPFPAQMRNFSQPIVTSDQVTSEENFGPGYRLISNTTYLKNGNPIKGDGVLRRYSERVVRLADNKVLGDAVSFGRTGGDFVALGHPSSNHCPAGQGTNAATRAVFIKEEK